MPKLTEKWVCPHCGGQMDIAPLGLYAEVQCPHCMYAEIVHAQVGNFRLEGVLGIGGMSVVYRAIDIVLNRPLAIKVLNDTFRDQSERIERFENESAMMARVRHENVTSVYSAGRAYGQFYIAMELVEGTNLEHMVTAEQPLEAQYALSIIRSVALGLDAANKAGLLHRDMKPGNILITPEGAAKVIDFGLAVDSQEGDTEEIIWATPYYVPPETLQRKQEDVRTDIYALGMTLRYLLTGVESFDGPTDSISGLLECKRKHPSFAKQRPDMLPELCELVDHMTRFSPAERPENYRELIEEIDEVQRKLEKLAQFDLNPRDSKMSRVRQFSWAVIGSLALGVLLAVYLRPSNVTVNQRLVPIEEAPTDASRRELDALKKALQQLGSGENRAAVNALLDIARRYDEPTLGAWCALLAKIFADATADSAETAADAQRLLERHLANRQNASKAGERILRQLSDMAIQPLPRTADWENGGGVWSQLSRTTLNNNMRDISAIKKHPVLDAVDWYILAQQATWLGDETIRGQCIRNLNKLSTTELEDLSYMTLLRKLASFQDSLRRTKPGITSNEEENPNTFTPLPPQTKHVTFAEAEKLMNSHKLQDAQRHFSGLAQDSATPASERARSEVLAEVCMVAQEMTQLLSRLYPGKYKAGMPAKSMAEIVNATREPKILSIKADAHEVMTRSGETIRNDAAKAIDGDESTRWCAPDPQSGHYIELQLDGTVPISHFNVLWEGSYSQRIKVLAYAGNVTFSQELNKQSKVSIIPMGGRRVDRVRFTINGTGNGNWASVCEIKPVSYEPYLAHEVYIVGLLLESRYDEAMNAIRELLATERPQPYFNIIAKDWMERWQKAQR